MYLYGVQLSNDDYELLERLSKEGVQVYHEDFIDNRDSIEDPKEEEPGKEEGTKMGTLVLIMKEMKITILVLMMKQLEWEKVKEQTVVKNLLLIMLKQKLAPLLMEIRKLQVLNYQTQRLISTTSYFLEQSF